MRNLKWITAGVLAVLIVAAIWWHRTRGVEAALLAEEPFRILKRHDHADYADILDAWRKFQAGEITAAVFTRESNAAYSRVATRRLATASQDSVQALMRETIRTLKKLRAKSPEACFRYLYPEVAGPPDVAGVLEPGEQRRMLELMGEVVRTSAEHPVSRPAQAEIEGPLADIINATFEQYGTDAQMVGHPEDPRIDRGRVCEITLSLYERILALPPDVSTKLLRYMAPGAGAG
jgi:hypothetical protein